MEKTTPRRAFLQKSVMATTSIALLSSQMVNAFTTDQSPFEGYNPFAEEKTDLRKNFFGKQLAVSGTIYNDLGTALPDATVEVWHLSSDSGKFRHRGKFKTDAFGHYAFQTDFPGKEPAKRNRIYFKISKGEATYFTELVISGDKAYVTSKHWEENKDLGDETLPESSTFLNETSIKFNIKFRY